MEEEERVDPILREEDLRTETCNESRRTVTDDGDVSDSDKKIK